ncbi:hypothetical protein [[Eubacterium] cellulosolvens]
MSGTIKDDHSKIGGTLILIGGILALIFPIFPLTLSLLMRKILGELFEEVGSWVLGIRGLSWVPHLALSILLFIMIGAIVTIICGALAIYAYTWVKRGKMKEGGLAAIMVGVVMVVTLHWIPGIVTIIGGALCYMSEHSLSED